MPVKKTGMPTPTATPIQKEDKSCKGGSCGDKENCNHGGGCKKEMWCKHMGGGHMHKLVCALGFILLIYVVILVGTMIRNNIREYDAIGYAPRAERMISFEADGKVTVKPDIAQTTIGMISEGETVAEAQETNTKVMNALIEKLKGLDISADDIQTSNYNVYPRYNYTQNEGQTLEGYTVSQNVTVKIREIDNANQVIALAGEVGANSVSGLSFTIDDTDVYKSQARDKALVKVYEKASKLSRSLGVDIIGVVSYDEYEQGTSYDRAYAAEASYGLGGGAPAPQIEAGSTDVVVNVRVTFEIR